MRMRMKDKISSNDISHLGGFRGQVIFGRNKKKIPFIDPFGNKSYRTEFETVEYVDNNIVTIGGYQFAFDKLFNIGLDKETTLRVGDLNDEAPQMKIGVPRAEYQSINYNAESSTLNGSSVINAGVNISALNFIFGFMTGDGGAREDNVTAIAPNYKSRSLFRAVPFRMSVDDAPIQKGKYYGKSQTYKNSSMQDPITSYYVKKFDDPAPRIVHSWVSNKGDEMSIVDDTVFSSTSSMAIESYVEINLSIDVNDCRGYFASTGSSPRINEFGLVSGWYNPVKDEYESLRLFSHFTRPSITLAQGDYIEAIYRLYAR